MQKTLQYEQLRLKKIQQKKIKESIDAISTHRRLVDCDSPTKIIKEEISNQPNSPSSINEEIEIKRKRHTMDMHEKAISYVADSKNTDECAV